MSPILYRSVCEEIPGEKIICEAKTRPEIGWFLEKNYLAISTGIAYNKNIPKIKKETVPCGGSLFYAVENPVK